MIGFLDIETGGFSTKNGVCEIALIVTDHQLNQFVEFQSYIKPYQQDNGEPMIYTDAAFQVHGLSEYILLSKGNAVESVLIHLINILESYQVKTIIGHNSNVFDVPRVEKLLNRYLDKSIMNLLFADTQKMAKAKYNFDSYSLENLCEQFGIINQKSHSALGDVKATLELYKKLI